MCRLRLHIRADSTSSTQNETVEEVVENVWQVTSVVATVALMTDNDKWAALQPFKIYNVVYCADERVIFHHIFDRLCCRDELGRDHTFTYTYDPCGMRMWTTTKSAELCFSRNSFSVCASLCQPSHIVQQTFCADCNLKCKCIRGF